MITAADYPFLDILGSMILFFLWVIWIWVLVIVLTDVFVRHDLSGWGKAGWTLLCIILPFIGVLAYVIAHGDEMGERRRGGAPTESRQERFAKAEPTNGATSQIVEAKRLLDEGAIDQAEYAALKRKVLS